LYRDLLRQSRSRELVDDFLDGFIARHGWWAARAAWVSEAGMLVDPWRVGSDAPAGLEALRHQQRPVLPIDPGETRFVDPQQVPVPEVRCTRGVAGALEEAGVDELVVVDVAGMLDFDVRLVFAAPPGAATTPGVIEALRTGAALLPTVIRQDVERDELRLGALRDPLTALLNRAGLDELAARVGPGPAVRAVIYLDLDGFKEVNDAHGHAAGDEVLINTAKRLARQLRPTDLVARLGGDEFVVLAASVLDELAAVSLAQRLVAAISHDTLVASGAVASVSASAGVAIWGPDAAFDETVAGADALMYEAKRIGGGIAVQDATGRILVRDPYASGAPPEEVDRGRAPVRARAVSALVEGDTWGVHVLLRGELCSVPLEQTVALVDEAVVAAAPGVVPARLIFEPRGRGWSRDGLLLDLVTRLVHRYSASQVLVMVDSQPASTELRLLVDEVRARLGVGLVLGGVGSSSGGDVRLIAQTAPSVLALDHEAVLNLQRSQPAGIAATLGAAIATAIGAPLLVVDPPARLDSALLASWGVSLAVISTDRPDTEERPQ
jgi:diguanylate cyclase (GGDEF)-like protein